MKKTLQSWVARFISSELLLNTKRATQELRRRVLKQPHIVSVFIRADDPYSFLLLQVMLDIEQRFQARFEYHVVSHLQEHMYPEPILWHENALKDSAYVADLYNLNVPTVKHKPSGELTESVTAQLLAIEHKSVRQDSDFVKEALSVLSDYWTGQAVLTPLTQDLSVKLASNDALLDSLGHYLSATLHYAGEWYWSIDRLSHLEHRLNKLKLNNQHQTIKFDENTTHFCRRLGDLGAYPVKPSAPLTIYFSARSPYSYLGLERAVALAKHYGVAIEVKPVLPMMMRGMFVPPRKTWYIFLDTKREAQKLGLDYGYVADPLGPGVERCYALFDYAKSHNREVEYLLAFARGVNARGIHSDTDQGMKKIVEEAGLDWAQAQPLLQNDDWRSWAETNYEEMHSQGLWGVPCFHYDDTSVWGQDRIDVLEQAICDAIKMANQGKGA